MSLLKKFDELTAHLNADDAEGFELAEKLRKELEAYIEDAEDDQEWLSALEAAGVDNWEGYEEALSIRREWQEDLDD